MSAKHTPSAPLSRRAMLRTCSLGFGSLALAGLMSHRSFGAEAADRKVPGTHFKARAKRVIFCYMSGGVSHIDSFDPKPELARRQGQPMPVPVKPTMFNNNGNIMAAQWDFKPRGQSGMPISDLFPLMGAHADDLAVIRSMTTKVNEHAQGNYLAHTGFPFMGHPSAGAWVNYGLGTENENLPGFVVLQSGEAGVPHGGVGVYSNGFLPAQHQASLLKADAAAAMANIQPHGTDALQRRKLGLVGELDAAFLAETRASGIEAAIRNYETAYRMQAAVPELCDLSGESELTKRLYGLDDANPVKAAYGRQCLVARRLIERGVRFVELSCLPQKVGGGQSANPWDQHGGLKIGHAAMANQVDQGIAALITDLKARGLFEDTIILWAGEFGRTPFSQGNDGRDHNPSGFSVWLAGGGVRGGTIYGETDELGYHVVDKPATFYDLYATMFHLLGIDHEKLTYRYGGRDFRLSDVHGQVIRGVLS